MQFRKLKASEIDARVSTVSEKGCSLLLYKDARVDQNLLDETFGIFGWQRKHDLIDGQLFCTVSVQNPETKEWVSKQDVGTESYTEKEKGRASDAFKRACFNLGIGRELYTAPFIWIGSENVNISDKNGKKTTYDTFRVKSIGYDDEGNINALQIVNCKTNKVCYTLGQDVAKEPVKKASQKQVELIAQLYDEENLSKLMSYYKVDKLEDLTLSQASQAIKNKKGE